MVQIDLADRDRPAEREHGGHAARSVDRDEACTNGGEQHGPPQQLDDAEQYPASPDSTAAAVLRWVRP